MNVRDDARLHVIAMIDPACNGDRIFAFDNPFTWDQVLGIFRKLHPNKSFPDDLNDGLEDLSKVPNADAEALLKKHYGHGFIGLEETIRENIEGLS